ncbi:MAG TPA: hypothetical protein VL461_11080 [Dictyobacter sp.]|jgi:hypothetical protein|nr:hypothetical protein [Dictyobacter sp.]
MTVIPFILFVSACSTVTYQARPHATVTIDPAFQAIVSPEPTPLYRCGAWTSNNTPDLYGTITIYAKLTSNVHGISGATAQGIVHFADGDVPLQQRPISDKGGYVSFTLPIQGRQPQLVAATIDISFNLSGKRIHCSQAFFTPQ